jgi:hypothetical protein
MLLKATFAYFRTTHPSLFYSRWFCLLFLLLVALCCGRSPRLVCGRSVGAAFIYTVTVALEIFGSSPEHQDMFAEALEVITGRSLALLSSSEDALVAHSDVVDDIFSLVVMGLKKCPRVRSAAQRSPAHGSGVAKKRTFFPL